MKKIALVIAAAALVGATSTCFAGFGLPSVPSIAGGGSSDSQLTKTTEKVDLDGIMENQKVMTEHMIACNNYAVDGWIALNNATGNDTTQLVTLKAQMNDKNDAESGEELSTEMENAAKVKIDEKQVVANAAAIREAIAQAKEAKTTAENERTKAALLVPAAASDIAKGAKQALSDFDFAKQFNPVKKMFDINKKMLSQSDKNLKAMNKRIARLEDILKKANV